MNIKTALVVDDSKSARFAMRKFLENAGYRVDAVESAGEAFVALRKALPDVLFLDHVMPDIDGMQALNLLRQDPYTAALPVVLCSSNEGTDFMSSARAHGAKAILLKPPSLQQITDVLHEIEADVLAMPTPISNKVHPIREPEVAIEQAVMKSLREALPGTAATGSPPLRAVGSATPVTFIAPPHAVTAVSRPDVLREEMESRLHKITHDLYAQLAATKAQLAYLDGDIRREDEIRRLVAAALEEQFALITQQLDARLSSARSDMDALISRQDARIERLGAELRESVTAEAHAVSERVVMNAASRISDQIAESILNVLKPDVARARG